MNKISHMYNIFFKLKRFYLNSYVLGYWTLMIFNKKERKRKRNRERVSSIEKIKIKKILELPYQLCSKLFIYIYIYIYTYIYIYISPLEKSVSIRN